MTKYKRNFGFGFGLIFFMALFIFPITYSEATFYSESPTPGFAEHQFKNGRYYLYLPQTYKKSQASYERTPSPTLVNTNRNISKSANLL